MIIDRSDIVPVEDFISGLQRTVRSLIRVSIAADAQEHGAGQCTGWLITDRLVVIPAYAVVRESEKRTIRYICTPASNPERNIRAELVLLSDAAGPESVAVLSLSRALSRRIVRFSVDPVHVRDTVLLLHHPGGGREASVSTGSVQGVSGSLLHYDASTAPGSGGAPVLNFQFSLVAMHMAHTREGVNRGVALDAILDQLRPTPLWPEIAKQHRLADVESARKTLNAARPTEVRTAPDIVLQRAAVQWQFDPHQFSSVERTSLQPLVLDPGAKLWTLRPQERERIISTAGSLKELQKAQVKSAAGDARQRTVDRILAGPPYSLDEVEERDLPYWLQSVRWFAQIEPALPTPGEVNRVLERRRLRSRLFAASPDFRGRKKELKTLNSWYRDVHAGPIIVTGIGGVGKSALVARFASELDPETLLLWLDFDRADLAPDDAISVLSLLNELAALQRDGFTLPAISPDSWKHAADVFGDALAKSESNRPPPLLVIDGFEVAQYRERHQEMWHVLERIVKRFPSLRVLVAGRASVTNLQLDGRAATPMAPLAGLEPEVAEQWLHDHGIENKIIIESVKDLTQCVPLKLAIAVQFVKAGGVVKELPKELPQRLVDGFLYQRVLDRIIDPELRPLAKGALILRKLTPSVIRNVLDDALPEGLQPEEAFSRLAREMALVSDDSGAAPSAATSRPLELTLQPAVRTAVLRLLEVDDPGSIREIDQRAANWYEEQDSNDPSQTAELVYHRLRLGDIAGAEKAWRPACAALLKNAVDDLSETAQAERTWLRARVDVAAVSAVDIESWEHEAAERIRAALGRGLVRALAEILGERPDRSYYSPLIVYDAWVKHLHNDSAGAIELLKSKFSVPELPINSDFPTLAAFLLARSGQIQEADRLLQSLAKRTDRHDRIDTRAMTLALQAANIRLRVDLEKELTLLELAESDTRGDVAAVLERFLLPFDVLLPGLSQRTGHPSSFAAQSVSIGGRLRIPRAIDDRRHFRQDLIAMRRRMVPDFQDDPVIMFLEEKAPPNLGRPLDSVWSAHDLPALAYGARPFRSAAMRQANDTSVDLAVLSARRWELATSNDFLVDACEYLASRSVTPDQIMLSASATMTAFRGNEEGSFTLWYGNVQLDQLLERALLLCRDVTMAPPSRERAAIAVRALRHEVPTDSAAHEMISLLEAAAVGSNINGEQLQALAFRHRSRERHTIGQFLLRLYLFGPDPLESIVRRIIGWPDNLAI